MQAFISVVWETVNFGQVLSTLHLQHPNRMESESGHCLSVDKERK